MKKNVFLMLMLVFFVSAGFAKIVNYVIARVGTYTITSYDLKKAVEFQKVSGNQLANDSGALKELMFSYSVLSLAKQNKKIQINHNEVDTMIRSITNITNSKDPGAKFRLKLYRDYPDQYKLQLEKSQAVRALAFYDPDLKAQISSEPTEAELLAYYKKNKKMFVSTPELNLIVLAVEEPRAASLDQLVTLEKSIPKIGNYLKRTGSFEKTKRKFGKIHFTSYSGLTGLHSVYELIQAGIPEAVVSIALRPSIQMGQKTITIRKGSVVAIPAPVPIRETGKRTYLVIKVLNRKMSGIKPYAEAKEQVKYRYKEARAVDLVKKYVAKQINEGNLEFTLIDNKYKGVRDAFIGR